MTARRVLITGSSGLIGSGAAMFFDRLGWEVHGIDNNFRAQLFGSDGDTRSTLAHVQSVTRAYTHYHLDIRDRAAILQLVARLRPQLILHCAAQPSHDLAKDRPFDDFEINALGTLHLLEAARRSCAESPFIFMSTNKVYGDVPNEYPLVELDTRYDYADPAQREGINETCRLDTTMHSLFGASKVSADILVQEYGRYFNMPTVCFRAGCLTGPRHAGAELHGFLAYLARAIWEGRLYKIYGYKGKQVRDNLHVDDVCAACLAFSERPRTAAVYNLGGGRANSLSVVEAISLFERALGKPARVEYVEQARRGDHICYISDLRRFTTDYPSWQITKSVDDILLDFEQVYAAVV
jgi:CDP-paratose 2-epimerase